MILKAQAHRIVNTKSELCAHRSLEELLRSLNYLATALDINLLDCVDLKLHGNAIAHV